MEGTLGESVVYNYLADATLVDDELEQKYADQVKEVAVSCSLRGRL